MASLDFMILSKLMSYVFTFLGVMIVWRTFAWLRKDRRQTHKRLKALPDAGTIGILTVLQGSEELEAGTILPVPFEGVLGFVRTCDVVVPVDDVVSQHLDFTFRNGKGLYIYPRRGCPVAVDGVTLDSRTDSRRYPMQHGSILCVGEAVLQLGVFAGLDVEHFNGVWQSTPAQDAYAEPISPEDEPAYDLPDAPVYPVYPDASTYTPPSPPSGQPGPYQPFQRHRSAYPADMPWPPQPLTPPERRPDDDA